MQVSTRIAEIDREINKLGIMLQSEEKKSADSVVMNKYPTSGIITGCHVRCTKTSQTLGECHLTFIMFVPGDHRDDIQLSKILSENYISIVDIISKGTLQLAEKADKSRFFNEIRTCTKHDMYISCLFYINGTLSNISITEGDYGFA